MRRFSSLRALLLMDAVSCAGLGALLLAVPSVIANWTDIPPSLLHEAGLFLIPIATSLALIARMELVPHRGVALVVAGNLLWVAASLLLPLLGLIAPNALGWVFLSGQAGFVTILTWLEARALVSAVPARAKEVA